MLRNRLDKTETIFALSSGALPSAVAILRVSGPRALQIAVDSFRTVAGEKMATFERGLFFGKFVGAGCELIDEGLLLAFPGNKSFTGEPCVEFQCHGSVAIVRALEKRFLELGARPAEAGEFSYRAHLNSKLSAQELETLGDLFRARDTTDISNIYKRKDGSMAALVLRLRQTLTGLLAIFDTAVDFSEEYSSVTQQAEKPLELAIRECSMAIQRYARLTDEQFTPKIVLVGRPNAGKSSLFNALLCRYRALVHAEPGTTRDVLEEDFVLGGRRWKLVDTAGRRSDAEGSEREGIELGEHYLEGASFWILVVDGTHGLSGEEEALLRTHATKPCLIVWNKRDLSSWTLPPDFAALPSCPLALSALEGDGVDKLWRALEALAESIPLNSHGPLPTHQEYAALQAVSSRLDGVRERMRADELPEYLSEEVRAATGLLERLVGEVDVEHVLDRVFKEFCIGK